MLKQLHVLSQAGDGSSFSTLFGRINSIKNSVSNPDPHKSALWEISWIQIRTEDADPDPGGKKINIKPAPVVQTKLEKQK